MVEKSPLDELHATAMPTPEKRGDWVVLWNDGDWGRFIGKTWQQVKLFVGDHGEIIPYAPVK